MTASNKEWTEQDILNDNLDLSITQGNMLDVVKYVDAGADINFSAMDGKTALMAAARVSNQHTFKYLLAKGADIKLVDQYGDSVLQYAMFSGDLDMVKMALDAGAIINAVNKKNRTPLMEAVVISSEVVNLLLDRGAKFSLPGLEGQDVASVLIYTMTSQSLNMMKLLLERGADANEICGGHSSSDLPYSPLIKAAELGIVMVDLLITHGAQIDFNGGEGTALYHAAMSGRIKTVELLLKHGANTDQTSAATGNTALTRAASSGRLNIVNALIAHGADVTIKNLDGDDALALARKTEHHEIAAVLEQQILSRAVAESATPVGAIEARGASKRSRL